MKYVDNKYRKWLNDILMIIAKEDFPHQYNEIVVYFTNNFETIIKAINE